LQQFFAQLIGIMAVGCYTTLFSFLVWLLLKTTMGIRVSRTEEIHGLDLCQHGMEAYGGFFDPQVYKDR